MGFRERPCTPELFRLWKYSAILSSPSILLAEADLRIGEVQWGDSGVYICKVVISDDLEGQNEASVELLVLGKTILKICEKQHF